MCQMKDTTLGCITGVLLVVLGEKNAVNKLQQLKQSVPSGRQSVTILIINCVGGQMGFIGNKIGFVISMLFAPV